jgi:hypothetical protein
MASYPAGPLNTIGLTISEWDAVTAELGRSHPALAADLAVAVHAQADRLGVSGIPGAVVPLSLSPPNACLVHEAAAAVARLYIRSVDGSADARAATVEATSPRHDSHPQS